LNPSLLEMMVAGQCTGGAALLRLTWLRQEFSCSYELVLVPVFSGDDGSYISSAEERFHAVLVVERSAETLDHRFQYILGNR
jgi:hypothetical protein